MNTSALSTIDYQESGDVARVTLKTTHINMKMLRELTAVCDHLEDQSETKVVVFRGSNGTFCTGIDFEEFTLL